MAPNLLLLAKKAVTPWEWIKPKDMSYSIRKLYYSTVPMPGIYAITADKCHYLVAIRPEKGKKDTESIFVPAKKSWNVPKTKVESDDFINGRAPAQPAEYLKKGRENSDCSKEALSKPAKTIIRSCDRSIKREVYCLSCKIPCSILNQRRPTCSVEFILDGKGGHLPHQKSPFRKHRICDQSHHRFSSFLHMYGNQGKCGIQKADINGFKRLRHPLRIEFCSITKRWMFSTEIRIRTEIVPMCSDIACMRKSHETCEREIWRKMFVLDDGYSWVVVGKRGSGKKGAFFRVDYETDCMRRQSKEEMMVSRWFLERGRGRFLASDEGADYMAVVRYIEKERVRDRKGDVYRKRIERESAELARLQQERLEKMRLERERSKKLKVENLRLEQRKSKGMEAREGEMKKARAGEVKLVKVDVQELEVMKEKALRGLKSILT